MNKIGDWLNSIPLVGVTTISFFVGTLYGKGFPTENWETLTAGFMGVCGGAFALQAAKWTQRVTELKAAHKFCWQCSFEIGQLDDFITITKVKIRDEQTNKLDYAVNVGQNIEIALPKPSDQAPNELAITYYAIIHIIQKFRMRAKTLDITTESAAIDHLENLFGLLKKLQIDSQNMEKICEKELPQFLFNSPLNNKEL